MNQPVAPLQGDPPRDTTIAPWRDPRNRAAWIGWPLLLFVVGLMVLARLVWLQWFSGLELSGDEAQYWDWSRRLDLSYATKGPGIAWLIALGTAWLGTSEFGVRVPAVLCHGLLVLVIAAMAAAVTDGAGRERARAACYAGVAALLIPGFTVSGMLMTIDVPYLLCWALAAWMGWMCVERSARGRSFYGPAFGLGLALGVGFLFKYTIVLLVPGMLVFWWLRRGARPSARRWQARRGIVLAAFTALLCMLPVVIWNGTLGFPTVRHLLGHLRLPGGDRGVAASDGSSGLVGVLESAAGRYEPMWTIEYLGAQLGMLGPMAVLMVLAIVAVGRERSLERKLRGSAAADERVESGLARWEGQAYLVWCGAPVWVFYLLVTGLTAGQGNWPIAAYVTLSALVGVRAAEAFPKLRGVIRAWEAHFPPRPRRGFLRRKPESAFQIAWHWSLGYGGAALVGSFLLVQLASAPVVGRFVPIHRLTGHAELAEGVQWLRAGLEQEAGAPALIAADRYQRAALLAFYLPDRPVVRSAASLMGDRESSYDYFADTRWDAMTDEEIGRPAVLVGGSAERWSGVLELAGVRETVVAVRRLDGEVRDVGVVLAMRLMGVRDEVCEAAGEPEGG